MTSTTNSTGTLGPGGRPSEPKITEQFIEPENGLQVKQAATESSINEADNIVKPVQ